MSSKLKLLYVGHRYHTNQVPIMKGWHDLGVKVKFLVSYVGVTESHDYVTLHKMKPSLLTWFNSKIIKYKYNAVEAEGKRIRSFRPDLIDLIIQIMSFKPDVVILREFSLCNLKILTICRIFGVSRIVMYTQDPYYGFPVKSNLLKTLVRSLLFPSAIFSPIPYNGTYREKIEKTGRAKYIIPLVCMKPIMLRKNYFNSEKINILDIGKYRAYKNHHVIVDAISKVKNPGLFNVTIIGQMSNDIEKKYYDDLECYVKEKKLENIIDLRENIKFDDMDLLYSQYDVFILASREPASVSVLESMSNGLCVVSSIYNGTSSYIEEYDCGFTFDPNAIDDLVSILNSFTKEKIKKIGLKAQAIATSKLNFNAYLSGMDDMLQKEYNFSIKNKLLLKK